MRKKLGKKQNKIFNLTTYFVSIPKLYNHSRTKTKVVPSSLIAQGSVTLTIKIKPQLKTQINFLFQPYLKNQTKHNYC